MSTPWQHAQVATPARDKPKTRKEQRELTHARFIESTLQLLEEGGAGALSVSELGRRVGVHHSLFYAHFKDLDAVLTAAASQLVATLGPIDRELRRQMLRRAVTDRGDLSRYYEGAFARWLDHPSVVGLLLSHRAERSAMGEALREALTKIQDEIHGELSEVAKQLGVSHPDPQELSALSALHLNHFLWALQAIIDGHHAIPAAASMQADLFVATNNAFFKRLVTPPRDSVIKAHFGETELQVLVEIMSGFRKLLRRPIEDVIGVLGEGDTGKAIAQVYAVMDRFFVPPLAQGQVQFEHRITHAGQVYCWTLLASPEGLSARPSQPSDNPRVVMTLALPVFLATLSGQRHFDEAHRSGAIEITGDIFFALDFMDWFYLPRLTQD